MDHMLDKGGELVYNTLMKNETHICSWTVAQSAAHQEILICYDCGETRKVYVD